MISLPLPPIPKTDKQKYYRIFDLVPGQRFVGLYKGVSAAPQIEHQLHLLDGQIAFVEGCSSLRKETEVLKTDDLVAFVYQGKRSYIAPIDGKERSVHAFDVFVLANDKWTPSYVMAKSLKAGV
jgi:hypothetical protein